MRITSKGLVFLLIGMLCPRAGAEGIWFSFHEASGSGWSNVFDGGPVEFAEGSTTGPDDDRMTFSALDLTQPGSLGADAGASGRSEISPYEDDGMRINVELFTGYTPSFFPGGDNPGGAAEGELFSIIEFVMPVDELTGGYLLRIDDTIEFGGSTSVLMENVTQSETILDLASEVFPGVEFTLTGNVGDVIRITSMMSGAGETPGGSVRQYHPRFDMILLVPEPRTGLLVLLDLLATARRRRASVRAG